MEVVKSVCGEEDEGGGGRCAGGREGEGKNEVVGGREGRCAVRGR